MLGATAMSVSQTLEVQEESTENQQILRISIYDASGGKRDDDRPGERVVYHYADAPDFANILAEERASTYIDIEQRASMEQEKMAVLGKTSLLPPLRCA
jgi:hypothetical protein